MSGEKRRRVRGWDALAAWYDGWVGPRGSEHHRRTAIPASLALLEARSGERILDIGCGQGVLAPHIAKAGAQYTGVDVSPRLLARARRHHGQHGRFLRADAAALTRHPQLAAAQFEAVVFLLSLQDMDPLAAVIQRARELLAPRGRVVILMTHPCFRVPRQSGWGWDEGRKLRYRRIDRYLTPLPVPMKVLSWRERRYDQLPSTAGGIRCSFGGQWLVVGCDSRIARGSATTATWEKSRRSIPRRRAGAARNTALPGFARARSRLSGAPMISGAQTISGVQTTMFTTGSLTIPALRRPAM